MTKYYDANAYTAEEILGGNAVPVYKYLYIYDENGNLTAQHEFTADNREDLQKYITWEYDENGNMIRQIWPYSGKISATYYNAGNLPVKKEEYYVGNGEKDYINVEYFDYDEEGNLITEEDKWGRMEYDRLGNLTKKYISGYNSETELDAQWIYEYHYSKK